MSVHRFAIVTILTLVAIELLFHFIYMEQVSDAKISVAAAFKTERNLINTQNLAQSLIDLEHLGLLKCISARKKSDEFSVLDLNPEKCGNGIFTEKTTVQAIDGSLWEARFRINQSSGFVLVSWMIRLLAIISLFLVYKFIQYRQAIADEKAQRAQELADWSRRIGHDIRSPLSALQLALASKKVSLGPAQSLVENALSQIRDISGTLLKASLERRGSDSHFSRMDDLVTEIKGLIDLKNTKYEILRPDIEFSVPHSLNDLQINIPRTEYLRNLSNLINNAIEAHAEGNRPRVSVSLTVHQDKLVTTIQDAGVGFSDEVLSQTKATIRSYNKVNGNGLGLSGAKEWVSSVRGQIHLSRIATGGSEVVVSVPLVCT